MYSAYPRQIQEPLYGYRVRFFSTLGKLRQQYVFTFWGSCYFIIAMADNRLNFSSFAIDNSNNVIAFF